MHSQCRIERSSWGIRACSRTRGRKRFRKILRGYRHGKITEVGRTEFQDHDTGEKGKATSFYSIIDDDGNYQPGKAQDVVEREKNSKNVKR